MQPTAEQQAVVDAQEGTVLVLAAVGSGKTTTLSHRLARTLAEGTEPGRVLAVTFTNRAATHLRAALEARVGAEAARAVAIHTFHALCTRILRAEADRVGLPPDFRIADEEDGAEILSELGVGGAKRALYDLHAEASAVPLGGASLELWAGGGFSGAWHAADYVRTLGERGAVDFAGLVFLARALMTGDEVAAERWSRRFDAVLVDEVQDTHLSEYEVLRVLGRHARSRCLVGDLDQTIYGWRGSSPEALLSWLERDFAPVRRLELTACFRATTALLSFADALARHMTERATSCVPHASVPEGEPPEVRRFPTAGDEERAIARHLRARLDAGVPAEQIAVLVRTNLQVGPLAAELREVQVPHATVEQFRFYRRAEVKDALALAALVHDRTDEGAARRVCRRLVQGVGPATIRRLLTEGRRCGLRLHDLLDEAVVASGDPLGGLSLPEVVVLDTETTGLDPGIDEVVEVAAVLVRDGRPTEERLELLLRPSRPVGDSEAVHGLSDAQLAAEGLDPAEAFARLARFVGGRPVAGHNVGFDVAMLRAQAEQLDVELPLEVAFDTLPVARRLVASERYTLGHLVELLELPFEATHRALDDVLATVALARHLAELAALEESPRRMLLASEAPRFARLRRTLDAWAVEALRPGPLVRQLTAQALRHKYPGEPHRLHNLAELARRLEALDDAPALPPGPALARALERAALVREVDSLDQEGGVRIVTIHQSKGLEFQEVVVPGLVEGGLPGWRALKGTASGDLEEERRLLYVAVTRAKRRLLLTLHDHDHRGRKTSPSRFLAEVGRVPQTEEPA